MRRSNLATVINLLIAVTVTLRTCGQGAPLRTKLHTLMFGMTINTTDSSSFMRLDHRRGERIRAMTRRTSLLHAAPQRMTISTRAGIWRRGNRRDEAELRRRVCLRDRRGRKGIRIPIRRGHRN